MELVQCIWQGLISSVEWSARPDQHEGLALREVGVSPSRLSLDAAQVSVQRFAEILEPFCNNPKTEVTLINSVQVYCYEDTRVMKAFPQMLKVSASCYAVDRVPMAMQVLYSKDCISDQAIIYWYQKGAKANGKQHFLKAAEPLVKVRHLLYHHDLTDTNRNSSCKNRRKIAKKSSVCPVL